MQRSPKKDPVREEALRNLLESTKNPLKSTKHTKTNQKHPKATKKQKNPPAHPPNPSAPFRQEKVVLKSSVTFAQAMKRPMSGSSWGCNGCFVWFPPAFGGVVVFFPIGFLKSFWGGR